MTLGGPALAGGLVLSQNTLQAEEKAKVEPKVNPGVKVTSMHKDAVPGLPSKVNYLLVGAGTAAFSAFRAIKAADPKAKVLLIGSEGREHGQIKRAENGPGRAIGL